ncbi:MAG: MFS transporter [Symploca sp. SIO2E6]|nr:MFS transporter [Symploca sp. SIO2E6]
MLQISQKYPKNTTKLFIIFCAGSLTSMTGGLISPVFPEMLQQLQLEPRWAGMLVSMHALTIALFTPLLGILADRIGKVKVLITSLVLYGFFGVIGGFMVSLAPILATRGCLGIASGGISAASIGLLSNMYEGEARSRLFGYATSAMTTAGIAAPLVGGWVGSIHWQYVFYIYGLALPIALATVLMWNKERFPNKAVINRTMGKQLVAIVQQSSVIKLFLTLALAATVVYAVVIYIPIHLKIMLGAGPQLNGTVLAFPGLGIILISALVASRLGKFLGTYKAIALGFLLMALMLMILPLLRQIHWILPAAFVFGAGFGIATPNIYDALAKLAPPEQRSSVIAIGTGFNSLGQFCSPIFLGAVWKYTELITVFYVAAGIAVVTGVLMLLSSKGGDAGRTRRGDAERN